MNYPYPQFTTLADKALLVKLTKSQYQPYAFDRQATALVAAATGVEAGRYNKRLFVGSKLLEEVNSKFNAAYTEYLKSTVPWLDDGVRMAPNALYFELVERMRPLLADARAAAAELPKHWDAMVQADLQRLGPLGNPMDYPSKEEIINKFSISMQFFPVPSTQDFRIDVSEEDKIEMERAMKNVEANISKHLLKEMLEPVSRYVSKLAVPIGEKGSIFRDTLVENVTELVDRLPRLNIARDPDVQRMLDDIKAVVTSYSMTELRESPITREAARAKMAQVQANLAAFMGAP